MELTGYLTDAGKQLSAKLLTGAALEITRITAGSGTTASNATVLAQEKQTLDVGTMTRSGSTVTLPATLAAAFAETDYTLREIGIYANDPDAGEILCRIYRIDQPVSISAGGQLILRFALQETVSEDAAVSVAPTLHGLLLRADLEALMGAPNGLAALDQTGTVPAAQIPAMDASKISSGTFDPGRIPALDYAAPGHTHTPESIGAQPAATAINTGNIGQQSVNYANSAGNADTVDGYHIVNDPGTWGLRTMIASPVDLGAGNSLTTGQLYFVYE